MRPDVIVGVVPFIHQLVEIGGRVRFLECPQLVLGRLYLALHVGVLFWAVRVREVVCDELLFGRLIEVLQELLGALRAPRERQQVATGRLFRMVRPEDNDLLRARVLELLPDGWRPVEGPSTRERPKRRTFFPK